MKKRILSLCMALFVTVPMLPARAFCQPGGQWNSDRYSWSVWASHTAR